MAVQPKVCCVKSTKTVSMAVKAPVKRRFTVTNRATTGWRNTWRYPASSTHVPWAAGEAGARVVPIQRVSGRKRSTSSALASATSMATQKGTAVPRGASAPPSAHGMRNEILASGQKNEKDVPLTCRGDEGKRGRKKGKEKRRIDRIGQKA